MLLADCHVAVLSLKGLARVHKQLIWIHALCGLLGIIQTDVQLEPDISRAAVDTVAILCDALEGAVADLCAVRPWLGALGRAAQGFQNIDCRRSRHIS